MITLDGLPYVLATMQLEDVPAVSEMERHVFTLPWSSATFSYELRHNPSSEYLVLRYQPPAEKAGRRPKLPGSVRRWFKPADPDPSLLGYGGFWMMLQEAHICTLAVRPEWRGCGLGELLLGGLIERALARKAEVVTLEVRVSNLVAQNLYAKYGFRIVGRRKGYYSDNHEDAFIMTTDSVSAPDYQQCLHDLQARLYARLLAQHHPPQALSSRARA